MGQIIRKWLTDALIDENKLDTSVAGDGLAGGGGSALSVNVDASTITITTDTLGVPTDGIGATELDVSDTYDFAGSAGVVNVTTQTAGNNTTLAASTAFVTAAVSTAALSAGDGIDITTGTISVDLEAAGVGTGGLAIDAAQIRVDAGNGIELTAGGVAVDPDSVTGAAVAPLSVGVNGAGVAVDNDTIVHSGGTIAVGANSIGAAEVDETDNYVFSGTFAVATPTLGGQATNKTYVDSVAAGLDPKASCEVATDIALVAEAFGTSGVDYDNGTAGVGATLTQFAAADGIFTDIDGVTMLVGSRIIVKDEATGANNGIYEVTALGDGATVKWVLTRTTDFDGSPANEVDGGEHSFVTEGTLYADTGWVVSSPDSAATIGTTPIVWTQFSSAGIIEAGDGIDKAGNIISVDVTDIIDTNSGLTETTNNIQVNLEASGGLDFTAGAIGVDVTDFIDTAAGLTETTNNIQVDLETAGAGTGGLSFDAGQIRVDVGTGMVLDATGVTITPDATTGGDTAPVTVAANGVGLDVTTLDGDHLDIDFTPSNYTPDSAPAEAADVDDLAAHLKGIDTAIGTKQDTMSGGDGIDITTNTISVDLATSSGLEFATALLKIDPDSVTGATVAPITLNANGAGMTVDNDTIVHTTGTLSVGANSIGSAELDETDTYAFSNIVTFVTQTQGDNSTKAATTAYVDAAVNGLTTEAVEYFTLDATDITNKYVTLANTPATASDTMLDIIGGTTQEYAAEYVMDGVFTDRLGWSALGLDGELAIGDKMRVNYTF